jgi:Na+/H+ antiporter NhaD/arsenite permease-like protein
VRRKASDAANGKLTRIPSQGHAMRSPIPLFFGLLLTVPMTALAADGPAVAGIPVDFILFAATLLGVALFHHHTLKVALTGLATITVYKLLFTGFKTGAGVAGLGGHLAHEWVILTNLLCLLLGFALLARHFEDSHVPEVLPRFLPAGWKGGFVLLLMVFVLSSFLDNIAAALIGGTVAASVFQRKVHIGYLAAIVAASNAGGSGSVVGDTTTTMMWIDGVSPADVFHAYAAAVVAMVVFGIPAAMQQDKYHPIARNLHAEGHIDWARIGIVGFILVAAIATNVVINTRFNHLSDSFPFIGAAVVLAIFASTPLRKPEWSLLPDAFKGSIFLLSLVMCASMMPVEKLPAASWQTALGLGFVSAVFDNIPLTALALKQGGYDWGFLAYAVGFGGSMIWFGSSAGVALSNLFPEAKSAGRWLANGWHVAVGYVVGFFVMLALLGWEPHEPHKEVSGGGTPAAVQQLQPAH